MKKPPDSKVLSQFMENILGSVQVLNPDGFKLMKSEF